MHNGRPLKKADPSTIQDKLLVGYQGWFTCTGDGEPGESLFRFFRSPAFPLHRQRLFCSHTPEFSLHCPRPVLCELHNVRHDQQLEEVIMDGFTGSTTPSQTADVLIRTSGQMCRNTAPRNYTKRQGSELRVARNVIYFLQGTKKL